MEQNTESIYTANTVPESQVISRFTVKNTLVGRSLGHLKALWQVRWYNSKYPGRQAEYDSGNHGDYRLFKFKIFYNLIPKNKS